MISTARFAEALTYAEQLHRGQLRKGTPIPYVAHLLAVAALVIEAGADEETAIAALLHDAVEDQGGDATRREIRTLFGARVSELVDECSDTDVNPKPPFRPRKEAYLTKLETASPEARLISLCDKLHNARAILADYRELGEALWARFSGGREGTLWYYRALVEIFSRLERRPLVADLAAVVAELDRLATTQRIP